MSSPLQIRDIPVKLRNEAEEKIREITMEAPGLNALSPVVLDALMDAFLEAESDGIRVAVLTGAGKAFVAGADITAMKDLDSHGAEEFARKGHRLMSVMCDSPVISVAAVNGFAFGGGLELALACDVRIFSEKAVVGLPEVSLGLIPGFGGTQRLARLTGTGNAAWLILSGESISATDALRTGIAQKVVTPEELLAAAREWGTKVLNMGPEAVRAAKSMLAANDQLPAKAGLEQEIGVFASLFARSEPREGMTAFLEKRPARWGK